MKKKTILWGLGLGAVLAALAIKGGSWNKKRKQEAKEKWERELVERLPPVPPDDLKDIRYNTWVH